MTSEITNADLRTKCAEAMGWRDIQPHKPHDPSSPITIRGKRGEMPKAWELIPNYPESDAAVRELRESLSEEERVLFVEALCQHELAFMERELWQDFWMVLNSTPRDQAIAFLKTRGVKV